MWFFVWFSFILFYFILSFVCQFVRCVYVWFNLIWMVWSCWAWLLRETRFFDTVIWLRCIKMSPMKMTRLKQLLWNSFRFTFLFMLFLTKQIEMDSSLKIRWKLNIDRQKRYGVVRSNSLQFSDCVIFSFVVTCIRKKESQVDKHAHTRFLFFLKRNIYFTMSDSNWQIGLSQ